MREFMKPTGAAAQLTPDTNQIKGKRSLWVWLLFFVILSTGVLFRFTNLDKKVYWHDEVWMSLRLSGHQGTEFIGEVFDGSEIGVEDLQKYQRPDPDSKIVDTVKALASDDPKHPPLYYVLGRFWLEAFGPSIRSIRGLSALFSLLVFPALYWLCRELFESSPVWLVATLLMAVSPFHLLYAQEAYQYSLWTFTVLLASAALLRAVRLQSFNSWAFYAVTVAIALYTHTLSIMVLLGHALYVAAISLPRDRLSKSRLLKIPVAYLLATLSGLCLFMPWGVLIVRRLPKISQEFGFLSTPLSFSELLRVWSRHLGYLFSDTGTALYSIDSLFLKVASLSIVALMAYAIYFLWRRTTANKWWFVLTLAGTTFTSFALADLFLGGRRSAIPRYLIPSYLGVELLVAYVIGTRLQSPRLLQRRIWQAVFALLVVSGMVSCTIIVRADTWWNKYLARNTPQMARVVNQASRPLIISDFSGANPGNIISLSYRLHPNVRFRLFSDPKVLVTPEGFSDIFLFNPSAKLRKIFEEKYRLEPVVENELWRLVVPSEAGTVGNGGNSPAVVPGAVF